MGVAPFAGLLKLKLHMKDDVAKSNPRGCLSGGSGLVIGTNKRHELNSCRKLCKSLTSFWAEALYTPQSTIDKTEDCEYTDKEEDQDM